MATLSVALGRSSLSLSTLTITGTPGGDFWLAQEGISWPRFPRQKDRAPSVRYLDGPGALLARTRGLGTFPLTVYAGGDTTAGVIANQDVIQAALDQWSFSLTLSIDSEDRTYTAECVDDEIDWGGIDPGMVRARICRGTVAVPLYPGVS